MGFKKYIEGNSKIATVWHVSPTSNIYKLKATGRHGGGVQAVKQGQAGIYVAPSFRDCVKWWVSYVSGTKTNKLRKIGGYPKKDDKQFSYEYDEANIYEIEIPQKILEKCWYDNNWEKEFFIPEEYISQLKVVSSKKYKSRDLYRIYRKDEEKKNNDWGARHNRTMIAAAKSSEPVRLYLHFKEKLINYMLRGGYSKDSLLINNIEKSINSLRKIAMYYTNDSVFKPAYKTEFTLEEKQEINRIKNYLNSIFSNS